uniref:G-protein coupled receptors family 1 profile domain-containing protein n=1 Tax=Nannospalax galili TaxID=1026970 RepID=A0A8C6QD23_NANGA
WEFLLLGLSEDPELQPVLFGLFLSIYLVTVLGNLLIVLTVSSDTHLHTPMYFFLCNLSLVDIGFSSTTVPKMLVNIWTHSKSITDAVCLAQLFFFILFGCLDNLLLAVMAYDRLVAICRPLHYSVTIHPHLCGFFVLVSFFVSLLDSQLHFTEIPHFFCDTPELFNIACSDNFSSKTLIYIVVVIVAGIPVSWILYSYTQIVSSILSIPSAGGRVKAFSSCGSHLSVVCLFYGTGFGVYFDSFLTHSLRKGSVASVMYTIVTPMCNPFIYSLRNKDIKKALIYTIP